MTEYNPAQYRAEVDNGLVAFLNARIDEDEQAARIIASGGYEPPTWHASDDPHRAAWMPIHAEDRMLGYPPESAERDHEPFALVANRRAEWAHIIRWDPARVLAEVDAKRRIVNHVAHELEDHGADNPWWYDDKLLPILRLIALPYAIHPNHREEWRP